VEVERRNNWNARTDQRANSAQELAIPIIDVLGCHCAMQIEIHSIE
jgi:hypothetical protein